MEESGEQCTVVFPLITQPVCLWISSASYKILAKEQFRHLHFS
jgi:hypothetical protein